MPPGGSWDHVTTRLHITSHIDPIRHRIGSPRSPFLIVPPSAAVSAPGDHLAGSWEGVGRGRHILVSPEFVAAVIGKDLSPEAIGRRHFARLREPDHSDTIIQDLMDALASEILETATPVGSVFLYTGHFTRSLHAANYSKRAHHRHRKARRSIPARNCV